MTNMSEISSAAQEQILTALQASQTAVLDGVRAWASTVQSAVPADLPLDSIPGIDALPSLDEGVEMSFDFAKKLLATQESFAKQVLSVLETKPAKAAKS